MFNVITISLLMICCLANAKNPIIPNKGVNDPHIHIFKDRAYLYATHDRSIENTHFAMDEWGVWSSDDLVNWTLESVLRPEKTYIGKPFDQCWATDAAYRNGKYYFYFSEQNRQTGVVVGDSPVGPWEDPLGKPLLPQGLTSTHSYDQAVFLDEDGEHYIIFGVWDFYIARLNHDMISLGEEPRRIVINNPRSPYNQDGTNDEETTDDKPFVHHYNGKYYLSWGAFYAMSDHLYGPYDYIGTLMNEYSFAPGFAEPTWPNGFLQGRHGSIFEWHNQWYFAYCDISQTGNRRFRDTFISYVHFKENGEMAPVRVDGIGVGQYSAGQERIEGEDYFKADGFRKVEIADNDFAVSNIDIHSYLVFPNIEGLSSKKSIRLRIATSNPDGLDFTLLNQDFEGRVLLDAKIPSTGCLEKYETFDFLLGDLKEVDTLLMVFSASEPENFRFDYFLFEE